MANTCFNSIVITGPQETLQALHDSIRAAAGKDSCRHLRALLLSLGYTEETLQGLDAREDFFPHALGQPLALSDGVLRLSSESAWDFKKDAWAAVRRALPAISIYYLAEETSCDIFVTNDTRRRFFKTKWFLDSEEVEPMYFDDDCSLIEYVHDNADSTVGTFEQLQAFLREADEQDRFYSLHEVSYDDDAVLAP